MVIVAGVAFCAVFFAWNLWLRDPVARLLTPYTGMHRTLPLRSAELITRIPLYGVPGVITYLVLQATHPDLIVPMSFNATVALEGAALGIGLAAVASTVASAAFTVAYTASGRADQQRAGGAKADIHALKDTGWMRGYMLAHRTFPLWVFMALSAVSVLGEELSFRGVLLPLLTHGFGSTVGLLVSTAAFIMIQKVMMPSWLVASIPMASALVVGIVLGYLALTTDSMTLVIISHICFYLMSVLVLF